MFVCLITIACIGIEVGCDLWMIGSEKTGYKIEIETDQISYGDLQGIEQLLTDNGYKTVFRERSLEEHGIPRYPEEVYTMFTKTLRTITTTAKEHPVDVYLLYVKDQQHNTICHFFIKIQNWFIGGKVSEVKAEIDNIFNLIYQTLANKLGKEKVTIKRFGEVVEGE